MHGSRFVTIVAAMGILTAAGYAFWPQVINLMLPADSRPGRVVFEPETVTPEQFAVLAERLTNAGGGDFKHIERFRQAGILAYEGPSTCLKCHETMTIKDAVTGQEKKTPLWDNLLTSVHYRFFSSAHPNVYGFNGAKADDFPMGKIDRHCIFL